MKPHSSLNHQALLLGFLALASIPSNAAVLAGYTFGPDSTFPVTTGQTLSATTVGANVSASDISENASALESFFINNNVGYSSQPVLQVTPAASTTTPALAVSNESYFEFTVTPDAGYTVDLTNLTFDAARGGGNTERGWVLRSSVDSYSTDLGTDAPPTARPTFTAYDIDLSGPSFQDLSTATTFRVYTFSASIFNSVEYDNFIVNGTATAVPEASVSVMALIGMSGLLLRRRR